MSQLLIHGNASRLPLAPGSVDAVVTDPPYAEIKREYGRLTEKQWHYLMRQTVNECRRILKPSGSAVFILQANSESVGRMRPWLWEFMAWTSREWNMVQDVYWWNYGAPPNAHCHQSKGLMRPSLKVCVWLGPVDCYRNQSAVLIPIADRTLRDKRINDMSLHYKPSGVSMRNGRAATTCYDRGGSTPFNVMVCANSNSSDSSAVRGHSGGTPYEVCSWWIRYISPVGGIVCDPFCGAGTVGAAALVLRRQYIGLDLSDKYLGMAQRRFERPHAPIPRSGKADYMPLFGDSA